MRITVSKRELREAKIETRQLREICWVTILLPDSELTIFCPTLSSAEALAQALRQAQE